MEKTVYIINVEKKECLKRILPENAKVSMKAGNSFVSETFLKYLVSYARDNPTASVEELQTLISSGLGYTMSVE